MTSYVPIGKNAAGGGIFYVTLVSQANTKIFQTNPTLASGDFSISKDGGATTTLSTTPSVVPAGGVGVKITLSQAETNADNITIIAQDAAGAEWCSRAINIQTVARQIDDLMFPTTTGRSTSVSAGGAVSPDWANVQGATTVVALTSTTITNSQVVASVTGAVGSVTGLTASFLDIAVSSRLAPTTTSRTLNVSAAGNAGINWGDVAGQTTTVSLSNTTMSATQVVASVTGAVGSVTGNVGGNVNGNVVGSVGSVVGLNPALLDVAVSTRLAPTTAGRTFSVSAGGAGAVDWNNVQTPTATVSLTNTTISGSFNITTSGLATQVSVDAIAADLPVRLTKNIAFAKFEFFMVSSTDHVSGATGLTITAQRSIDGGALAACANAATEIGSGYYWIDFAATDLNGNAIGFLMTATGADPTTFTVVTQPT